ncbi:MAG: molybdopterin molybdotransferase MoeA [Clostridiales Family XIII bacterium]|jgi:molybdopterin molybdotransferase/putative molybdopterin biosynthesis protein|nr:molybdopterin molybdotransferase MoeA [Clostridiales Family XIII bacterium]
MRWIQPGELPLRAEVLAKFFEAWRAPISTEVVDTQDACGRILAEDVFAKCDKPVVRGSRMDGVAVKSEAFAQGLPDASDWTPKEDWTRADTGDDFPDEYDAVIPIEDVIILPGGGLEFAPEIELPIAPGTNVAPKGSSIREGVGIGSKGTKLSPCDIAAIASGAVSRVRVYAKPRAAFIPTGSELIPLGADLPGPARGQTVESNSLMARLMLEEMGALPSIYPIVRDDKAALGAALTEALAEADIVVFSAGTSKGEEDFSHALLAERGDLICHGVAAAPGRPLALAVIDGKPVINVAGPPVACFNGLDWCVRPIIASFFELPSPKHHTVRAKLAEPIRSGGPGFETIIRIELEETASGFIAHPLTNRERPSTDALRTRGLYSSKVTPEPTGAGDTIEVEILYP